MLEYQNISPKWSKKPKNQSDFHFFGQKCRETDQNFTKMIKKQTEHENICPKWSKKSKNRSDFHFSGQKNSKNWNLVWCFASILQIFFISKKSQVYSPSFSTILNSQFFKRSCNKQKREVDSLEIKFNFFHMTFILSFILHWRSISISFQKTT